MGIIDDNESVSGLNGALRFFRDYIHSIKLVSEWNL